MILLQKKFKQMLKYVDGVQMRDSQLLVRLSDECKAAGDADGQQCRTPWPLSPWLMKNPPQERPATGFWSGYIPEGIDRL